MVYIFVYLRPLSTIELDVSVPGLLSSTVRTSYIIFLSDNNSMLLLSCLMLYDNVFVFAVFTVSLHGD